MITEGCKAELLLVEACSNEGRVNGNELAGDAVVVRVCVADFAPDDRLQSRPPGGPAAGAHPPPLPGIVGVSAELQTTRRRDREGDHAERNAAFCGRQPRDRRGRPRRRSITFRLFPPTPSGSQSDFNTLNTLKFMTD